MCTPAKLFSISIIIIENNFAGVHMSFRIPSDRTIRHVPSSLECTEYSTAVLLLTRLVDVAVQWCTFFQHRALPMGFNARRKERFSI